MERWVIAIDVGGSHIASAAFFGSEHFLRKGMEVKSPIIGKSITPGKLVATLRSQIESLTKEHGTACSGAGIAVPAVVCAETEKLTCPNFPALMQLSDPNSDVYIGKITRLISGWARAPSTIRSDAEASARVEWKLGSGKGHRRIVYLVVSTGIGGVTMVDGVVQHCELGQIIVPTDQALNTQGGSRLEPLANTAWYKAQPPFCKEPKELAILAREGDPEAKCIFHRAGRTIGYAVTTLCNIWHPGAVVFGGGISLAADLFVPGVREQMELLKPSWVDMPLLVPAAFGRDTTLYGAALAAFSDYH